MRLEFWIVLFAVFVLIDIFFIWKVFAGKKRKFNAQDLLNFRFRWKAIMALEGHNAVIEADKLLHFYLRKLGYTGSMGEILKSHPGLFSDLDSLWNAHKQRNKIAHEIGFKLNEAEKKEALRVFYNSCRDIGL